MNQNKCPSCGAIASKQTNCEYCGSFLVRFKNADSAIFDKVSRFQSEGSEEFREVRKLIERMIEKQNINHLNKPLSIIDTGIDDVTINIGDNELLFQKVETKSGIAIEVFFEQKNVNLNNFRNMDEYLLFDQYDGYYDGTNPNQLCYRIDFGNDIDSATKVLSSFLKTVCKKTENDHIEYENFDETEASSSRVTEPNGKDEINNYQIKSKPNVLWRIWQWIITAFFGLIALGMLFNLSKLGIDGAPVVKYLIGLISITATAVVHSSTVFFRLSTAGKWWAYAAILPAFAFFVEGQNALTDFYERAPQSLTEQQ